MKVKVKDTELELFYTMRMFIIYENITNETVDFNKMGSTKQLTTLLLACMMASAQKKDIPFTMKYEEYMDWLDENGGYVLVGEFATWFANELETRYSYIQENDNKDNNKSKKAKG